MTALLNDRLLKTTELVTINLLLIKNNCYFRFRIRTLRKNICYSNWKVKSWFMMTLWFTKKE